LCIDFGQERGVSHLVGIESVFAIFPAFWYKMAKKVTVSGFEKKSLADCWALDKADCGCCKTKNARGIPALKKGT